MGIAVPYLCRKTEGLPEYSGSGRAGIDGDDISIMRSAIQQISRKCSAKTKTPPSGMDIEAAHAQGIHGIWLDRHPAHSAKLTTYEGRQQAFALAIEAILATEPFSVEPIKKSVPSANRFALKGGETLRQIRKNRRKVEPHRDLILLTAIRC